MLHLLVLNAGIKPVRITSASIITDTNHQVLTIDADSGFVGSSTVTVRVSDGNGGFDTKTFNVNVTGDDTTANTPFFINLPPKLDMNQGGTLQFQLQSADADSATDNIYAAVDANGSPSVFTVTVDRNTGLLTVTPRSNTFTGVAYITVAVAVNQISNEDAAQDRQVIPIYVHPTTVGAPAIPAQPTIRLAASSDSGLRNSDSITNFDNSTAAKALTFQITGVTAGNIVQLIGPNAAGRWK